jgi:hypothetical protein
MAALFYLSFDAIRSHSLRSDRATRLDASGVVTSSASFAASIVPTSQAPMRYALVAGAGANVCVGAQRVCGAAPLAHGDHVFVEEREFVVSLDSPPLPVESPRDAGCPVCDRAPDASNPSADSIQLACPRCGARACAACWQDFQGGVCLTPQCDQPAALERPLFCPEPTDFLDFAGGDPMSLEPS